MAADRPLRLWCLKLNTAILRLANLIWKMGTFGCSFALSRQLERVDVLGSDRDKFSIRVYINEVNLPTNISIGTFNASVTISSLPFMTVSLSEEDLQIKRFTPQQHFF